MRQERLARHAAHGAQYQFIADTACDDGFFNHFAAQLGKRFGGRVDCWAGDLGS